MAVSFSNLPPELLVRICDFMQTKKEIANFHQCSRQFHAIATPFLYRHVDLLSKPDFIHGDPRHGAILHDIEALVKAFIRDPGLGHMVQHLAIRLPEFLRSKGGPLRPLDPDCEALVRAILPVDSEAQTQAPAHHDKPKAPSRSISSDGDNSESDWESTDESADEDEIEISTDPNAPLPVFETEAERWIYLAARSTPIRGSVMLAILLSRLPNLECLDLEMPAIGWRTGFLDRAIQSSQRNLASSESSLFLKNVRQMCFGFTSPHLRGESWAGPFILPSVTEVYLHNLSGLGPTLGLLTPNSLNITHLELRNCRIPSSSLIRLLAGPKALKTFVYVVGEVQTPIDSHIPISYRAFRTALEKQKDSLEQIWLDYPHDYQWDDSSTQLTAPMGNLTSFTKLKHLRIAGTYIFGFVWTGEVDERRLLRALPEQIETVCICHADEDEETVLGVSLVLDAKKQGRFQQFRQLTLEARQEWYADNRSEITEIIQLAESVNLDVRLLDNHSDTRLEHLWERNQAAFTFTHSEAHPRRESPWGFNGEKKWPVRVSGCMQIPVYEDITEPWRNPVTDG